WIDGKLAGERTGFALRTDNVLRLNSLMLDGSAVAPQTQRLYIDDVQVLTTSPVVAPQPPAPVAAVIVTLNAPSLTPGQTTQAGVVLRDAAGTELSDRQVT